MKGDGGSLLVFTPIFKRLPKMFPFNAENAIFYHYGESF